MNAALTPKQTQLYLLFPADLILPNRRALFILVQHLNVSIPVPERYQFYNINSNKKEITLHITVQIFSFIFQLSIFPIQAVFSFSFASFPFSASVNGFTLAGLLPSESKASLRS